MTLYKQALLCACQKIHEKVDILSTLSFDRSKGYIFLQCWWGEQETLGLFGRISCVLSGSNARDGLMEARCVLNISPYRGGHQQVRFNWYVWWRIVFHFGYRCGTYDVRIYVVFLVSFIQLVFNKCVHVAKFALFVPKNSSYCSNCVQCVTRFTSVDIDICINT